MLKILSVLDSINVSAGYVRLVREGEEFLNAGLVISVGIKQKEGNILHIQAQVPRTSGITTHLYLVEIWIDLKEEQRSMASESLKKNLRSVNEKQANRQNVNTSLGYAR